MGNFYEQLAVMESLREIANLEQFARIPEDWWVVITDIRGSTEAIAAGQYKAVNLIAAASIVAVLNGAGAVGIPFVFGGDGASLAIPANLLEPTRQALVATQLLAAQAFQLDLRVALVPVAVIHQSPYEVRVAKLRVSPEYTQAIFIGGGLKFAEALIKDPRTAPQFAVQRPPGSEPQADYSGLECRWQDIRSPYGETLSLLISATSPDERQSTLIYQEVLEQIERIYGAGSQRRPVNLQSLHLTFQDRLLQLETLVHQGRESPLVQAWYRLRLKLENLLGWCLIRLRLGVWGKYPQLVVSATDFEKLDDLLRMVIAISPEQRQQLTDYLETRYRQGELVYGIHISDRALLTCLVFERDGRQVHFVDGADGGYALAARDLKARLNA
ncbi:MAG: DUF3095 domain-containing protein [Thermostichus sp. BF3_bins_97]